MLALPRIMVAPNGARRTKADHPSLPVTVAETVAVAAECYNAGAGGLHAHVRGADGAHVLDSVLYKELIAEMARIAPEMAVQITTEAVGRYSPAEQGAVVTAVMPAMVSVALGEMIPDAGEEAEARRFYHFAQEAGIAVQHILYGADEVGRLAGLIRRAIVPADDLQLLFVLGRYTSGQQSDPSMLVPFLQALGHLPVADWAVCSFGHGETDCLLAALASGGKARIGFENSLWHRDGSLARSNNERVEELVRLAGTVG